MTISELQEVLKRASEIIGTDALVFIEDDDNDVHETFAWKLTQWMQPEAADENGRLILL